MPTSKWLVTNNILMFNISLAAKIGLNEAIVLQRLHYWLERDSVGVSISGERFIYNTYEEWQETNFPFWSLKTIQRTFRHLEKMGLIVARQAMKRHYDRKKYYQINYEKLEEL